MMDSTQEARMQFESRMTDWSHHVQTIRSIQGISQDERSSLESGFLEIRTVLGEDWLKRSLAQRSPVVKHFLNSAPWVWRSLSSFGQQLLQVRQCPGFAIVAPKLASPQEFSRTKKQVRVASHFLRAGYEVSFEPPVGGNRADLLVKASPDHYIELKDMDQSDDQRQETDLVVQLSKELLVIPGVAYDGRILRLLSKPHLAQLITRIREAAREIKDGSPEERVFEEGAFDITLFKVVDGTQWSSGLRGPPSAPTEMRRLRRTIHEASWKQLPQDEPSLLLIHDSSSELLGYREAPDVLFDWLAEAVYEHSNLMGVVLSFGWLGQSEAFHQDHEGYQVFRRLSFGMESDIGVIIKNRFGRFQFREDLVKLAIAED